MNDALPTWAERLGISSAAAELYASSDVVDLHIDSFIWQRLAGYDLTRRHGAGLLAGRLFRQVDFPRLLDAHVTGGTWVITTNPLWPRAKQAKLLSRNFEALKGTFEACGDHFAVVGNVKEYFAARDLGKHGAFIGIQGGTPVADWDLLDRIAPQLLRVTLVHLSSSFLGDTSSPLALGGDSGLTPFGRELVKRLNAARVFVDLAHVSRRGFFDALREHDPQQPFLVTHTGVRGVHDHWRNLDDEQIRAVAASGGTIGILFHTPFLGSNWRRGSASRIVDHMAHIIAVAGEDFVSLGSDWDGFIITPRDMPTCSELPRLVQLMLDRGWSEQRVQKILGKNFLRVVQALRG